MARDQREDAAIVHPDREARQLQARERVAGREDELDLRHDATDADHVDIALRELTVAALLWSLRAPHRADLDGLERLGQARMVLGVVARERNREVEAQPQVGKLGAARPRALELIASLEDLEDELLVLAAVAADEEPQALERRRLNAPEAVAAVHPDDELTRR